MLRSPLRRPLSTHAAGRRRSTVAPPHSPDDQDDRGRATPGRDGRCWSAPRRARPGACDATSGRDGGCSTGPSERRRGDETQRRRGRPIHRSVRSREVRRAARRSAEGEDRAADVLDGRVDVVDRRGDRGEPRPGRCGQPGQCSPGSRPIANSRWITRSCRSRPIRSRSSKSDERSPVLACARDLQRQRRLGGETLRLAARRRRRSGRVAGDPTERRAHPPRRRRCASAPAWRAELRPVRRAGASWATRGSWRTSSTTTAHPV